MGSTPGAARHPAWTSSDVSSLSSTLPVMVDALKRDPVAFYRTNKLELPKDLAPRPEPAGGST